MEKNVEDKNIKKQQPSDIKPEDLEFDENIDDRFSNKVFNKYKQGQTKNKWFKCSGIFSILFGTICIVTMIVVGIVFVSSIDSLQNLAILNNEDFDKQKMAVIISCIVIPIIGVISILIGIKIAKFSSYDKEKINKHLGQILFYSLLQFIFGGTIFVIITLIGYFVGIGSDYGAIYYNRIDGYKSKEKMLNDAKTYYENDLIDYNEYKNLKDEILNNEDLY